NILSEVQSRRDQLFALSMANVNDSTSGESNYESYNNIILDEIASIRDRIDASGSSEDIKAVTDEIAQLKALIDERDALYEDLAGKVSRFDNDATNNKILEELTSLRTELANQRDADLTTLNFMSEMAHLLERQNSYIAQNTGSKITDEIESLKAEIASSDAVAEEVAKLREIMTQSGNASDNDTILSELADLREELSSEKPSRENELILQEISRLRDEITMIAERESVEKTTAATKVQNTDALADSLSDLKDQLNEIAGIIEPEQKPKTTRKKSSNAKSGSKSTSKSGTRTSSSSKSSSTRSTTTKTSSSTTKSSTKKSGASAGTGAKRGKKSTAQKSNNAPNPSAETVTPVETIITSHQFTEEDFDAKVDEEIKVLGGDAMSLNPNAPLPSTQDTMDVADKLAQQVANKLVIEQLVEQLGDDGMSEEQVDEILRELPIELTTKALDDQSARVRKLANQLVLNKLRNRLGGKKPNN
ncbi:MAG: hypothetical protein K2M48_02400, partial [Clostridiales bacterium]|nr:hypothetical protein [Clostridiales bacterium]